VKTVDCLHKGTGFLSRKLALRWALSHDCMLMQCPYCKLYLPNPGPSDAAVAKAHIGYRHELGIA
jgi:hypothetical protein